MENWVIGTKLFILLYCGAKYAGGDMKDGAVVLLFILTYICMNMLFYILKKEVLKRTFLIISFIILLFSTLFVNMLFVFLLPINMAELAGRYKEDPKLSLIPAAIAVVLVNGGYLPEYVLISIFSLIVFILSNRTYARIASLEREIDQLREKNDALYQRLDMGAGYENQVKYLSQMEERNSLSQKIHDKIGHAMAGSLIQLEAAVVIMDSDRGKSKEIVENVIKMIREGLENIRSTLRSIKPAPEQLGINRLKVMLDEFSLKNPIKADLAYRGSVDLLSHAQWRILMDNVKESLTNSLKYSAASVVKVDIEVMNKLIRMEIRDNGVGAYAIKKGLGLRGIEERTENAGGKIIIDGSKGFSIITLLPVSEVASADKSINR